MNAVRKKQAFQTWHADADGLIHLRVCSHEIEGGDEGLYRLKNLKIPVSESAALVLEGLSFQPTLDRETQVVIIPGSVFHDRERKTEQVSSRAMGQGYTRLSAEPTWLLLEALDEGSMEAMGFRQIVVMHKPVPNALVDASGVLCIGSGFEEDVFVDAVDSAPEAFWRDDVGFAFVDPT